MKELALLDDWMEALRLDDVSLLRGDETVFNAMVDGWRAQMLAQRILDHGHSGAGVCTRTGTGGPGAWVIGLDQVNRDRFPS